MRTQTEKLNILRREFAFLNARNITTEKENEALIHKLATITMKMQEIEEMTTEKVRYNQNSLANLILIG